MDKYPPAHGIAIQPDTFKAFCGLIYNECGIAIGVGKEALLVSRLGKRLAALGMTDYGDYYRYLTAGGEDADNEMVNFLDCLTSNTTSFFRDGRISEGVENICDDDSDDTTIPCFLRRMGDVGNISDGAVAFLNKITPNPPDFFRDKATFRFIGGVFRDMVSEGRDKIRVWSAGCSTGEEPYSVAITFLEHVENYGGDFKILATDLSTRALCSATRGTYRQREMEIFPLDMRRKYFTAIGDGEISYKVRENLSSLISFARLNLAKQPFPMEESFDIILCRDVMLFFDNPARIKLIKELEARLRPGGYLVVGSGESIKGLTTLKPVVGGFIFMKE